MYIFWGKKKGENFKSFNIAESNMHRKTNVRGSFEMKEFV